MEASGYNNWQNASAPSLGNVSEVLNSSISRSQMQRNCKLLISFSINAIAAGVICILGFIGNVVSFAILSRDKGTTPVAAFLLRSLAFADNFFLSMWFVNYSLYDAFVFFGLDRYFHVSYLYQRIYSYPLVFIGQTATIWLTVLIAASRFIAVCLPYRASTYCNLPITKRGVIAVLVFSVLYNLPRFFETELVTSTRRNVTRHVPNRTRMGSSVLYNLIYFDILYYIFTFVLPLILLFGFNTRLTIAYRAVRKKRSAMRMHSRKDNQEQNITLVMIIVILVFMVCNAPARIVQILFQYSPQRCPTVSFFLIELSTVLEVLSSSANFLIYVAFRKQFRHALHQHLACSVCPRGDRSASGPNESGEDTLTKFGRDHPLAIEKLRQTVESVV